MIRQKPQQGNTLVIIIVIAAALILVGTLGYILWNNSKQTTQTTIDQTPPASEQKQDITLTLPNGRTATYPATDGNKKITFADADNGDANTVYVKISHKSFQEFLVTVDENTINNLCGTDSDLRAIKTDIIVGLLNTDTKVITPPQNQSCVDVLASTENSDATLRAEAQAVLDQINSDIAAFLESVTIR